MTDRADRIASGPQAWRLNREGRLAIVDKAEPITAAVASKLIAEIAAGSNAEPAKELDA